MRFPLEVVVVGKEDITCRIHIKYAYNMELKPKNDDLYGTSSKTYAV
jgi:hypothetical protein